MRIDAMRLRSAAPIAAPAALVVIGWLVLVAPISTHNARDARDLTALRQRVAAARTSLAEPLPPPPDADATDAFRRVVPAGDATPLLVEQLARRAADARAAGLTIETGERVTLSGGSASGPQLANLPQPDPRLALFDAPLTMSPITMAFDAGFPQAGAFLWSLRDLATIVEIRSLEVKPQPQRERTTEHVTLTLFAYARPAAPAVVTASAPGAGQ